LRRLGISIVTLWRLLEKVSFVRLEYVKPLLKLLSREDIQSRFGELKVSEAGMKTFSQKQTPTTRST